MEVPQAVMAAAFDSLVGVATVGAAGNLALSTDHRGVGANSVEWDKLGTGVVGSVVYTPGVPLDLGRYGTHAKIMVHMYIPSPIGGNITNLYIALGTDAANLFTWEIPLADIVYDAWNHYHFIMSEVSAVVGVGANLSAITYVGIHVTTNVAGATVVGILVDDVVVKRSSEVLINQPADEPLFVDVIDRAGRLVGIFYGDLGQILQLVPADALAPGNSLTVSGFNFVYNGATWDMVREGTVAGSILVDVVPKGTIINGQVITNIGVRAALAGATPITSVTIKALSTTTGLVYVGNATVAAGNGYILSVNESVSLDIDNLNKVFIDVSVNGEGVSYIAIV